MHKSTYAVQVFVNRRYITVSTVTSDISVAFDKFTSFNRTGDAKFMATGVAIDSLADRPTRLISTVSTTGKTAVLRKGRTATDKVAA